MVSFFKTERVEGEKINLKNHGELSQASVTCILWNTYPLLEEDEKTCADCLCVMRHRITRFVGAVWRKIKWR